MTLSSMMDLNDFLSGHLVVDKDRRIVFCNNYICELSDHSEADLINTPLSNCITKASTIFIDSYVYPLLINESIAQEVQITWIGPNGTTIPVVVNIKFGKDGLSNWSVYVCTNRDKLQSE